MAFACPAHTSHTGNSTGTVTINADSGGDNGHLPPPPPPPPGGF
ncbi:hypothetical protein [Mucilaginibacter oryzae]|nr:hypothetical protein [Mucilaginibacter oryzae]